MPAVYAVSELEKHPNRSQNMTAPTQETNTNPAAPSGATAPVVDVQAQINAALAGQQADFAAQLEQATGHKDLPSLTEANLKAQGKLQELADSKTQEAKDFKAKYEQTLIGNALLSAAGAAVDPNDVVAALSGKGVVAADGAVTIDGKPVSDAVKALLATKPHWAKAEGNTGSGALPATTLGGSDKKQANDAIDPLERLKAARRSGAN